MKKFMAILLSATTVFTCSTSTFANQTETIEISQSMEIKNSKKNRIKSPTEVLPDKNKKVFVDDEQIELKEGIIVYQDRIFLPVRELSDALDLDVFYKKEEKIVAIHSLKGSKIQLPVNENKAVVNGKIVPIDKENDKVGTIVIKDKTYLPVRFISESLGYNIEYNSSNGQIHIKTEGGSNGQEQTEEGLVKLDKDKTIEAYNQVNKALENIKNYTATTSGKVDLLMSYNDTSLKTKMDLTGTTKFDLKENLNMYLEQKFNMEIMGEKETINQKIFYKDGKMYVDQDGIKYKIGLGLQDAMEMYNPLNPNDILVKHIVLGGSYKDLGNGNKRYIFDLDMSKVMDIFKQFSKELDFDEEDLEILKSLEVKNTNITIDLDSKNQPISYKVIMDMKLDAEGINLEFNIDIDMKYSNIGTTVVDTSDEDLSKYEDFDKVLQEVSAEVTT
ncbi:copper amine oxidase N-terminal domain-containing protein [uncultured Tyzzerella sp.]|uniref:copper amine oxidase N-terminal domain-containing protein n=1 Tax=uncultured Tyzzerella sp. TaxID=2321398 RepID=UPI002943B384|nr:copper amine oxidase N-terminal domain-containing protein [uncultured Tyzzerella sp.]